MSEIEPYYTDDQVAKLLDPTGKVIKSRSIRSERERGRLIGTRVAGKWLYRHSDVLAFLDAARQPRQPVQVPAGRSADEALRSLRNRKTRRMAKKLRDETS